MSAGGPSSVPVMTKTFASTLTAAEILLARRLFERRARATRSPTRPRARRRRTPSSAIDAAEPMVRRPCRPTSRPPSTSSSSAAAAAYVAALEGALKLKEMALVHAEGTESWEMASGAATLDRPDVDRRRARPARPRSRGRRSTSPATAASGAPGSSRSPRSRSIAGADHLPIAADAVRGPREPRHACRRSRSSPTRSPGSVGIDPDEPGWTERYRSQGLTHVIGAGGRR